jgi:four helix bundle protein
MCGCADVRMCGCADVRMCGCADVRMCGCADVRMCGCADVRMCGCADVRMKIALQITIQYLQLEFSLSKLFFLFSVKQFYSICPENQLFRSGTSIGAHVEEAQGPESRADFIHKMKGGYKEACESLFWLRVFVASPSYPDPGNLPQKASIIIKVIGKFISSTRNNGRSPETE